MLSSDKNVESIATLVETLKDYVVLQKKYLKYDVVEKLVRLSAALLLAVIIFALVLAVVFYLSFALVYAMAPATGVAGGFAIVGGFYLLLLFAIYYKRKAWVERPLVRILAGILLDNNEQTPRV